MSKTGSSAVNHVSLREYLTRYYHRSAAEVMTAMGKPEHVEEFQRGVAFKSDTSYIGDLIAKAEGWEFDDALYDADVEEEEAAEEAEDDREMDEYDG